MIIMLWHFKWEDSKQAWSHHQLKTGVKQNQEEELNRKYTRICFCRKHIWGKYNLKTPRHYTVPIPTIASFFSPTYHFFTALSPSIHFKSLFILFILPSLFISAFLSLSLTQNSSPQLKLFLFTSSAPQFQLTSKTNKTVRVK